MSGAAVCRYVRHGARHRKSGLRGQGAVSVWNGRCSGAKKKGSAGVSGLPLLRGAEVQACVSRHPFFYVLIGLSAVLADAWPFAYGL